MRNNYTILLVITLSVFILFNKKTIASSCDSLTPIFVKTGNSSTGFMFNVAAKSNIQIQHLFGHFYNGTNTYSIYYKKGKFVGFENNASAWTFIDSASISATPQALALLPINLNLSLTPGDTIAFYLATPNKTPGAAGIISTTVKVTDSLYTSDNSISISQGKNVSYPFKNIGSTLIWNGTLVYCNSAPVDVNDITPNFATFYNSNAGLRIHLSQQTFDENSAIEASLFDLLGRPVFTKNLTSSETQLSTNELSKGIYICQIKNKNQLLLQKKIIIE